MSFVTQEDVLNTFELVMRNLFREVAGAELPPFERMPFDTALEIYGIDKPDLRFGMKLNNLTKMVQPCEKFPKLHTAEHIVAMVCEDVADRPGWKNKKELDKTFKKMEAVEELLKLA